MRKFCQQYNSTFPSGDDDSPETLAANRHASLQTVLGRLGAGAYLEPPFYLDYGCNTVIGDRFYSAFNFTILDCGLVTIGDRGTYVRNRVPREEKKRQPPTLTPSTC